ncbi:MAG: hypothetical protein IIB58_12910 [Planctomycetes bacterium]|nr:hypothetical protein [Planctomycetota bacterium]
MGDSDTAADLAATADLVTEGDSDTAADSAATADLVTTRLEGTTADLIMAGIMFLIWAISAAVCTTRAPDVMADTTTVDCTWA